MKTQSLLLIFLLLILPLICFAQSAPEFVHKAPAAEALPYPSQPLKLVANLNRTKDFRGRIRLVGMKDGKFLEVSSSEGTLNEQDQPTFVVEVPAPVAEIVYQFILAREDGKIISSKRYAIRRACVPDFTPVDGTIPESLEGGERLQQLLSNAKSLERELLSFETSISTTNRIKELLNQR